MVTEIQGFNETAAAALFSNDAVCPVNSTLFMSFTGSLVSEYDATLTSVALHAGCVETRCEEFH